ncbi:hypothetical protein M422DRAFT_142633, partial [Sphaerobolus stellatus SS14]
SWWPRPNTWEHSSFSVGYWSSECEHWYQARLKKIMDGTADLHSVSQWKKSL